MTPRSLEMLIDRLNDVFPDHYVERSFADMTEEEVREFRPKRAMAACIVKIATDLYDEASDPAANLQRIAAALAEVKQHLEDVEGEVGRLLRQARAERSRN